MKKVEKDYFILKNGSIKLNNGDGICFFVNNELKGTNINKVENNKIYPNNIAFIKENTLIYRNLDFNFNKMLESTEIKRKISD
ncbi:MAG: hypothetical protein MZU97_26745 [Bacillus subtilis]|nr:hypothetical protein [Bacillus subtilis]